MHNKHSYVAITLLAINSLFGAETSTKETAKATIYQLFDPQHELTVNAEENDHRYRMQLAYEKRPNLCATIDLKGNELQINKTHALKQLSLWASGGAAINTRSTHDGYRQYVTCNDGSHPHFTYYAPLRYLLLTLGKTSNDRLNLELQTNRTDLQRLATVHAVAKELEKNDTSFTLIIDIHAWLAHCYGSDWQDDLPFKEVDSGILTKRQLEDRTKHTLRHSH